MNIRVHPRIEKQHIDEVRAIDLAQFCIENPSSASFERAMTHPEMYTVLTHNEVVVGYGLVIPVKSFAHEALKRGEMDESELRSSQIASIDECSGLYVASIAAASQTNAVLRSRLVGYTLGSILRAPKEVFAIAISKDGDSIAREVEMKEEVYVGPLKGLNGYVPRLFVRNPFSTKN